MEGKTSPVENKEFRKFVYHLADDPKGAPMGCVIYVATSWPHAPTPHMPALGKGFAICFSQDLCQHASNTSVASYLNILQASLLHSCLHHKAKRALNASTGLFTVELLFYHSRAIILLAYNLYLKLASCTDPTFAAIHVQ